MAVSKDGDPPARVSPRMLLDRLDHCCEGLEEALTRAEVAREEETLYEHLRVLRCYLAAMPTGDEILAALEHRDQARRKRHLSAHDLIIDQPVRLSQVRGYRQTVVGDSLYVLVPTERGALVVELSAHGKDWIVIGHGSPYGPLARSLFGDEAEQLARRQLAASQA
jgi:hypothetical protein